jgi:hypothetical protein
MNRFPGKIGIPIALAVLVVALLAWLALRPTPKSKAIEMFVEANKGWTDTGLELLSGESVMISASGTVNTFGGEPGRNTGPSGEIYLCIESDCFMQNAGFGALVARISSGSPFKIGSKLSFIADRNGKLYLAINDNTASIPSMSDRLSDNSGSFRVVIDR